MLFKLKTVCVMGLLFSMSLVTTVAWADNAMEQAKANYQEMRFEDARGVFMSHADGDAEAQYYLGLMSWYGFGCEQNYEQAKQRLVQASDNGFKPAKWGLTMFLQYGLDIDLSPEESLAKSQLLMRECGYTGQDGVVKDEYATRFANDSKVLLQAMAQEMNEGIRLVDKDRESGISHLHKAEEYLVVAKKSGPMFSQPCQFILFNLHSTYSRYNIEPLYPELYERDQKAMDTGAARFEDQRQQLIDRLKKTYGKQ